MNISTKLYTNHNSCHLAMIEIFKEYEMYIKRAMPWLYDGIMILFSWLFYRHMLWRQLSNWHSLTSPLMIIKVVTLMTVSRQIMTCNYNISNMTQTPKLKTTAIIHSPTVPSFEANAGLILGLHPAHERRRYKVTPSLIGWAQTKNQPWNETGARHWMTVRFSYFLWRGRFWGAIIRDSIKTRPAIFIVWALKQEHRAAYGQSEAFALRIIVASCEVPNPPHIQILLGSPTPLVLQSNHCCETHVCPTNKYDIASININVHSATGIAFVDGSTPL